MSLARRRDEFGGMRFLYIDIYKRRDWRRGDIFTRRMIEIRYSVGRAVRDCRKEARVSQERLAYLLDGAPSTISAIERASPRVTLDQAVRALIVLGADDETISKAFNPALRRDVQTLRWHSSKRMFNDLSHHRESGASQPRS